VRRVLLRQRSPLTRMRTNEGFFLKGPVPWTWLSQAARASGRALQVGIALWLQRGMRRSDRVTLPTARLTELGLDRYAVARALTRLEAAGLVTISRRRGRKAVVTILSAAADPVGRVPINCPDRSQSDEIQSEDSHD
jgi:DNA-binding MarR family transcriptional regulator